MNTLTTNIIRNVYDIGNSCNAGTQYCEEGYALYFPCLKNITKGQSICFDFYIADTSTKDVVDLRDVDAITLDLNGLFGCTFGEFSYPDNISSLQREEYELIYSNDFGTRRLCKFNLLSMDIESEEVLRNIDNNFYTGTVVEIAAYDTPTHIFLGWVMGNWDEDPCDEETYDDLIISKENTYKVLIDSDINVFALYRPRKEFRIDVNSLNRSSHYDVIINGQKYMLSNKFIEMFDDGYDYVDILEGYHFIATCIPNIVTLDRYDSDSDDYMYVFDKWNDDITTRSRLFCAGVDTNKFEKKNEILLYSKCSGPVEMYELENIENKIYIDTFDEEGIHIHTEFEPNDIYDYEGDYQTTYVDGVKLIYKEEEGFLQFNKSTLALKSEIEEGIKVSISAKANYDCNIFVTINNQEMSSKVETNEFKMYEFYVNKCNMSDINIYIDNNCEVDSIEIYKEHIIDKGKAQLCLDNEITSNLPSGQLSVSGAIMVNGHSYGIANTQIGNINKLKKITY